MMDSQIEHIRKAYDLTVDQSLQGINPLRNVPDSIRNTPFFRSLYKKSDLNSAAADVKTYLNPKAGMRFLDAGCAVNLIKHRLYEWPSTYYGVDFSPKLIKLSEDFVTTQNIAVGALKVAEVARLPFDSDFFDIAALIGVLNYCTLDYIKETLIELNRVLKDNSRLVLDIPNENHPFIGDLMKLEEYLGRTNILHSPSHFEPLLSGLFRIERLNDSSYMLKYFLRTVKK